MLPIQYLPAKDAAIIAVPSLAHLRHVLPRLRVQCPAAGLHIATDLSPEPVHGGEVAPAAIGEHVGVHRLSPFAECLSLHTQGGDELLYQGERFQMGKRQLDILQISPEKGGKLIRRQQRMRPNGIEVHLFEWEKREGKLHKITGRVARGSRREMLRRIGCHWAQGNLGARLVPSRRLAVPVRLQCSRCPLDAFEKHSPIAFQSRPPDARLRVRRN